LAHGAGIFLVRRGCSRALEIIRNNFQIERERVERIARCK
jgi:hypothetical protein